MRRNRKQATSISVSLFPFLAVLICTMGVLIVMLVLAVKSSAVKAREAKQQHRRDVQGQRDELLERVDLENYRIGKISEMRPAIQQRLEDEKLRRSHLDDEIRKLVQEAKVLSARHERLIRDGSNVDKAVATTAEQIRELEQKMARRRLDLDSLRRDIAGRPLMYSIVPTKTQGGTFRRPIYVECSPQGIVLQPSGIRIRLDDFAKPVVPGNPLDAALLATREYWNKYQPGSNEGEPYPLIVVRPGGATAYAIARRAMTSWDDEFGYELVDSTKTLDWGEVDTNLAAALQQAIDIAMRRQNHIVSTGRAQWMTGEHGRTENGSGPGQRQRSGIASNGSGNDGKSTIPALNRGDPNLQRSDHRQTGSGIDTSKKDSLSRFASANRTARDEDGSGKTRLNPLRPAETSSSRRNSSNNELSVASKQDPAALSTQESGSVQPLSSRRGSGWALPTRTPGATPYRRPIRVECSNDHYLIYSGDPQRPPVRVDIPGSVDMAVDQLVHQIWKQIEGWGMAEIGGYWKPVLRLSADQNGNDRGEELARKLEGSGIEIERFRR